jgi:hypothetical protein
MIADKRGDNTLKSDNKFNNMNERPSARIDAGFSGIDCETDEDFLVAMCHIADCKLNDDEFDEAYFDVQVERQKIADTLMQIANCKK